MRKSILPECKRIVVKVGSSLVTNNGAGLNLKALEDWASQIATLNAKGYEIVLVSSGAVAKGMQRLNWDTRPTLLNNLQAAAAVGQMAMVQAYERCFQKHNLHAAQILLTHADLADRERYLNAKSTLSTLLSLNTIPVINENDTLVTDEIKFGDNDTLGALVTNLIEADVLIILTDQNGLYTADPRKNPDATLISEALASDETLESMATGAGSHIGRGGMTTKILAAKRAARSSAHTIIASGHETNILLRLLQGESIGTLLTAPKSNLGGHKQWLADHLQVAGKLVLDAGALDAILNKGSSLLPIGVKQVIGEFPRGAVIACINESGEDIAHGLTNYNSDEARIIAQHSSQEISKLLSYGGDKEIIHRDNLVLL
jgi:glutamate 5-kinase